MKQKRLPTRSNYVNGVEACELLGITTVTMGVWNKKGIGPPRNKDGNYPLRALGEWMQARYDLQKDRIRFIKIKADELEADLDERRRQLVDRDVVLQAFAADYKRFRARMLLLPAAAATQLAVPAERAAEARELLKQLVNGALSELQGAGLIKPA